MGSEKQLIEGPSKFDLMLALFDGKTVQFTTNEKGILDLSIDGISREDRTNESWFMKGRCRYATANSQDWTKFEGFFNTQTRKGLIGPSKVPK